MNVYYLLFKLMKYIHAFIYNRYELIDNVPNGVYLYYLSLNYLSLKYAPTPVLAR